VWGRSVGVDFYCLGVCLPAHNCAPTAHTTALGSVLAPGSSHAQLVTAALEICYALTAFPGAEVQVPSLDGTEPGGPFLGGTGGTPVPLPAEGCLKRPRGRCAASVLAAFEPSDGAGGAQHSLGAGCTSLMSALILSFAPHRVCAEETPALPDTLISYSARCFEMLNQLARLDVKLVQRLLSSRTAQGITPHEFVYVCDQLLHCILSAPPSPTFSAGSA